MKIRKLRADEIDIKIKKSTQKGSLLLLYKTARVDMDILDETYGPNNWQSDYKEIKGNLYAGIGVKFDDDWSWKWDCGVESRSDGDGNEKKGEASDAFKRAGFKWGIGRELYTSPFIFIGSDVCPVESNGRGGWNIKNRFEKFYVNKIEYGKSGEIKTLVIIDSKKNIIWSNDSSKKKTKKKEVSTWTDEAWKAVEVAILNINLIDDLKKIYESNKTSCGDQKKLYSMINIRRDEIKKEAETHKSDADFLNNL